MKNLYGALIKFQSTLKPIPFNKENPHFRSKFTDLTGLWDAVRGSLADNELCITQFFDTTSEHDQFLITKLAHSSGESIESKCKIIPTKNDAQSFGSAITYLRRYSFSAILGLTTEEDDDGHAATTIAAPQSPKTLPKPLIPALNAPLSASKASPNSDFPKCAIHGSRMLKSKFDKGPPFWCPECKKVKDSNKASELPHYDDGDPGLPF